MRKRKTKARKVLEKPEVLGWNTSDADEIEIRRWRGRTEVAKIEALEPQFGPYGTFRVRSGSGGAYEIEIRDLTGRTNSCGCIDHRVNGLGTCKHIEGVLLALRRKLGPRPFSAAAAKGSPRVEIFLQRDGEAAPALGGATPGVEAQDRPCPEGQDRHRPGRLGENNRAENSPLPIRRRERKILGFKSLSSAQRFLATRAAIYNTFDYQRNMISRPTLRLSRATTNCIWKLAAA